MIRCLEPSGSAAAAAPTPERASPDARRVPQKTSSSRSGCAGRWPRPRRDRRGCPAANAEPRSREVGALDRLRRRAVELLRASADQSVHTKGGAGGAGRLPPAQIAGGRGLPRVRKPRGPCAAPGTPTGSGSERRRSARPIGAAAPAASGRRQCRRALRDGLYEPAGSRRRHTRDSARSSPGARPAVESHPQRFVQRSPTTHRV